MGKWSKNIQDQKEMRTTPIQRKSIFRMMFINKMFNTNKGLRSIIHRI